MPVFLEVCCGSAGLSASMTDHGIEGIGVDFKYNKHMPKVKVIDMDLSTIHGRESLLCLCAQPQVVGVWFGLPSGTLSKGSGANAGNYRPYPLRTEREPWGRTDIGMQSLESGAAAKLAATNALYQTVIDAVRLLNLHGVPWAIENPIRSLLWWIPCIARLLAEGARDFVFDACMHGGSRKRSLVVRSTMNLASIVAVCDGNHKHEKWKSAGEFDIATEAEYPNKLCQALAAAIAADSNVAARVAGVRAMPDSPGLMQSAIAAAAPPNAAKNEVQPSVEGIGLQNRTGRNLIPEYKSTYSISLRCQPIAEINRIKTRIDSLVANGLPKEDVGIASLAATV